MLYDKRWDYKVKADPFTLESLIAWLEKKSDIEAYNYCDGRHCLLQQYLTDSGFTNVSVGAMGYFTADGWGKESRTPRSFWEISAAIGAKGEARGWTFGAALDRARKLAKTS